MDECLLVKDRIGYRASPKVDPAINVGRHINRTGYPTNNEQLVYIIQTCVNIH